MKSFFASSQNGGDAPCGKGQGIGCSGGWEECDEGVFCGGFPAFPLCATPLPVGS